MVAFFMPCHKRGLRVEYPLMNMELEELFHCPYCGSPNFLTIDYSGGNRQKFVNDCETCCNPIFINIAVEENIICINAEKENN